MRLNKKFRIKQVDAKGEVVAVIATLNVKDHDGDVTIKGAFGSQEAVVVPTHNWNSVPLGRATITEEGNDVVAKMRFNLDIDDGKKWYSAIKFDFDSGSPLQEYSYGYEIKDAEKGMHNGEKVQFLKSLKVIEVSPVLLGAGIDTGTLAVKNRNKAWAELAGSWESIQQAIRQAASVQLSDPYCYIEATLDASVIVCSMQWTGTEWQDRYFQFGWSMDAAGNITLTNKQEVQLELVVSVKGRLTFAEQFDLAVGELKHLHRRSKALAALREKEGRTLSRANWERLSALHADLGAFLSETSADLSETADEGKAFAAFLSTTTKAAAFLRT